MELPSVDCEFLSLCLAAATHSFLLFSFFPYAGYMAVSLLDNGRNGVTVDNVGIYAGLLGAAFTIGRFLGFVPWKMCRTRLGEKHALLLSLGLTGLASVWVGLSGSFAEAFLARLAQGLANCISGSVKRAAINAGHNRGITDGGTAYQSPILWIMWWGTALGPLVGGFLSDPEFLGSLYDLESPSSWYASHPFLLANGASGMLCWLSLLCVAVFAKSPSSPASTNAVGEHRPLLSPAKKRTSETTTLRYDKRLRDAFRTLWTTNEDARRHLLAYWSFSFVVVCWDEALPLFLITSEMGLSERDLGLLLSFAGVIVAISHHAALDNAIDTHNGTQDGMYRVLGACAVAGTLPIVLVYKILLVMQGTPDDFSRSSFVSLGVLVAVLKLAASIYFSVIGMATGRSLRIVHKDEAARVMTIGALWCRSVAPIAAGAVVSHFMGTVESTETVESSLPFLYHHPSLMVWIVIGVFFGGIAASRTFVLARHSGNGVLLTEKQNEYYAKRLERMLSIASLSESLDKVYSNATQSLFVRWNRLISHRIKLNKVAEQRRSSIISRSSELLLRDESEKERRFATWEEHTIAPGVDFDSVSFFILGTHKTDAACAPHVLTPPIMAALQRHLPMRCTESNFWLRYSLLRDGASTHSIEAKAGLARDAVLAIETLDGDIFGSFMTKVSERARLQWIPDYSHAESMVSASFSMGKH